MKRTHHFTAPAWPEWLYRAQSAVLAGCGIRETVINNLTLFCALAALVMFAAPARAGEIKVIANNSVGASSVPADELRRVFLITKNTLDDGSHVEPVVEKGGAAHETFLKEYLAKTDSALQTYYRSLVFTGKGSMPKAVSSDAEMVSFVAKTKGAIGYVSAGASPAGVKTLEVK